MKSIFRRRAAIVAVALLTAVVAASFVSPAVGGPSIGSVAKIAKKALKVGKQAKKKGKAAQRTASAALSNAGPPGIVSLEQEGVAAPSDFVRFDVQCPAGTRAVGIGQGLGALIPVFFASYGNGALGSMFNPSETTAFSGNFYVECVEGYAATAASTRAKKREVAKELERRQQEVLQAAR